MGAKWLLFTLLVVESGGGADQAKNQETSMENSSNGKDNPDKSGPDDGMGKNPVNLGHDKTMHGKEANGGGNILTANMDMKEKEVNDPLYDNNMKDDVDVECGDAKRKGLGREMVQEQSSFVEMGCSTSDGTNPKIDLVAGTVAQARQS